MKLISGKLYKIIDPNLSLRTANMPGYMRASYQRGDLVLFLSKSEYVPRQTSGNYHAYTSYFFLLGETKVELRKYYVDKLKDMFAEAKSREEEERT